MISFSNKLGVTFEIYDNVIYHDKPRAFAKSVFIVYWYLLWKAGDDNNILPPRANVDAAIQQIIDLANISDILFPSLYTFHPDPSRWERYAVANIQEYVS